MTTLEKELNSLPNSKHYKDKDFNLFIYPSRGQGWTVEYALGRFYCDADNGCCDDEYGILHGLTGRILIDAVRGMKKWLEEFDRTEAMVKKIKE